MIYIKYTWLIFRSGILTVMVLFSVSLVQTYFQICTIDTIDVYIGFPYHFFFFSLNGHGLHGFNIYHFLCDFFILLPISFISIMLIDFVSKRLSYRKN